MKFRCICKECRIKDKNDFFSKEEFQGLNYFHVLNHYHFDEEYAYAKKDIYIEVDVQDKRGFIFECKEGHVSVGAVSIETYELLYDRAIFAYDDAYYRETVANLAASIERFHEHCVNLMLYIGEIEQEYVHSLWKRVSKQSERQYGAFLFLYLNLFKLPPPEMKKINNKLEWLSFRNNVIHSGYFPSKEEAEKSIEITSQYIKEIREKFMSEIGKGQVLNYHHEQDIKTYDDLIETYQRSGGSDLENVDISDVIIIPYLNIKKYKETYMSDSTSNMSDSTSKIEKSLEEKIMEFKRLNLTAYRF
ncbi:MULTISPECIES: hypothetical protein [unclassified Exiguobacterium]|uniref:hypothetical protein n=1 Tax=unclassified Exiguobacterium TaxID=2644629 RepID=UPI001BE6683E|nr:MULTISPECIES: hypothetical protein [unclassified Exiguobacterium]